MAALVRIEFTRRPSTAAFMLRGLHPAPGLKQAQGFPDVRIGWKGHRVHQPALRELLGLTGLQAGPFLPLLYPQFAGFPLLMVMLTHPVWPVPLWRGLQIRNHLLQHAPLPVRAVLDLETRVAAWRWLEKGAEVDLYLMAHSGQDLLWESLNTFYYRGRFGTAGPASALATAPAVPDDEHAHWRTGPRRGWRFGRLTGDFNGIHVWDWYARRMGFRRAFHHPQAVVGECLARLPGPGTDQAQRLDLWLKGPVYYQSQVSLRSEAGTGAFVLLAEGEERPAILGRWRPAASGARLLDDTGQPIGAA